MKTIKTNALAALLAGTFLSTPAFATEITLDELNAMTSPNVTWSETSGKYTFEMGGKNFYYDYHNVNGYTKAERIANLDANVEGKLFEGQNSRVYGGAIYNESTINNITADFIGNYIEGRNKDEDSLGGAIYNKGTINNITGVFINNYGLSSVEGPEAHGGAIYNNEKSTILNITGDFIGNSVQTTHNNYWLQGGAIANTGEIGSITGNFIGNYVQKNFDSHVRLAGGAIANGAIIGSITGDFIGNYAETTSENSVAFGGAIANDVLKSNISGNFIGNYAKATGEGSIATGGAIATTSSLNFINDGKKYFFTNNYTEDDIGKQYNAITFFAYADKWYEHYGLMPFDPRFTMTNNATYVINDSIKGYTLPEEFDYVFDFLNSFDDYGFGSQYKTTFDSPDKSGTVFLADNIINSDITVNGTVLNLTKYTHVDDVETVGGFGDDTTARSSLTLTDSTLGLHNNYYDKLYLKDYTAGANALLHINVGYEDGVWVADLLDISGNITGTTNVIVYALTDKDNADASVVFAQTSSDSSDEVFKVSAVYGSPYMWEASKQGTDWYLLGNTTENPNKETPDAPDAPDVPDVPDYQYPSKDPVYRPEVIAGVGLHTAAIEQTRSMVHTVAAKTSDSEKLHNIWVTAQGETATIDKPVDMDADIWGVEAGFDIQNDRYNTLGVFASYRKGEYDLSGKGKVRSPIGSEIDIDSYLAGLYYRYDKNMNWAFATVYGGIQKADVKTDDGIAKFDTDGIEFGGSVEVGHAFALDNTVTLDPSVGLYYTQINFDDAQDNIGKNYSWGDVKHLEAEAGLCLTKQFETANIYLKPSVIQTVTASDKVKITGMDKKLDTYEDGTFGRVEIGGRYGFSNKLSAYGWTNYTFGSGYSATAAGVGLTYSW